MATEATRVGYEPCGEYITATAGVIAGSNAVMQVFDEGTQSFRDRSQVSIQRFVPLFYTVRKQ